MWFQKNITTIIEFTKHIAHFYAPINLSIYTLYMFCADIVCKYTPKDDKWGLMIWELAALLGKVYCFLPDLVNECDRHSFKLHLDVVQMWILSQFVFLDNENSQQFLLYFRKKLNFGSNSSPVEEESSSVLSAFKVSWFSFKLLSVFNKIFSIIVAIVFLGPIRHKILVSSANWTSSKNC